MRKDDRVIRYKVTTAEGVVFTLDVTARSIDSGFTKAVAGAKRQVPEGDNLHSIEFYEVRM